MSIFRYAWDDLTVQDKGWVADKEQVESIFIEGWLIYHLCQAAICNNVEESAREVQLVARRFDVFSHPV